MYIYLRCNALPKKTFKIVKETWNDAILQVKENQKNLLKSCVDICKTEKSLDKHSQLDKWHGRIENREVKVYNTVNQTFSLNEDWLNYTKNIIKVTRTRNVFCTKTKKWKESQEQSFYLSSIELPAKIFNHAIRWHRWIENKNHRVKDVTMKEDLSRIRKNPQNIAKLKSLALNIMRKKKVTNIENECYINVLNINKMMKKYDILT